MAWPSSAHPIIGDLAPFAEAVLGHWPSGCAASHLRVQGSGFRVQGVGFSEAPVGARGHGAVERLEEARGRDVVVVLVVAAAVP